MAQEVVGPNRPLRDIRNVISKEYNTWVDEYAPTSEGLRSGKIYVEEAKPKLQEQRERLTVLYTKFDDLRQQAGKANPYDPTLIKDLESTLDAVYNNSKSIDYDLKLIRNFEKAQEPKQAAATQTAGESVETKQGTDANAGTVSTEESARINNNSGGGEPVIGTSGGAGGTGNNRYSQADAVNVQDAFKLVESQSVDATATQVARWGMNEDAQYIAGTTDIQQWDNTITVDPAKNKLISRKVTPNPLHAYSNYTYGLSLHMLSKSDFNQMAKDPDSDWLPTTTIVASAGKYGQPGFNRAEAFEDDFYFDSLKFKTVIGNGAGGNAGTNALTVEFTLVEPYGLTFIDRLQDACLAIDGKSYLDIPYLLQIDFHGYDDEGVEAIELKDQRKYIPVKLLGCRVKAGIKGSEYMIEGVVYPHAGFFETVTATPANFEVRAGTLEQFFKDSDTTELVNTLNERAEAEERKNQAPPPRTAQDFTGKDNYQNSRTPTNKAKQNTKEGKPVEGDNQDPGVDYSVNSYIMAYNAWQQLTVKRGYATAANKIMVVFDKSITENGGGVITDEKVQSVKRVANKSKYNPKQRAQLEKHNTGDPVVAYDPKMVRTVIKGATSVIEVINKTMIRSAYIRKQMKDPTKEIEQLAPEDRPVNWYKIIPSVELTKFCEQTSTWKMNITYSVVGYTIWNQTHPNASVSIPLDWVKDYQYIYTGQNNDIIDFNIEFQSAFYTLVQVDKGKNQATEGAQASVDQENKLDQDPRNTVQGDPRAASRAPTQDKKRHNISDDLAATATGQTRKSSQQVAAASFAQHVNNDSAEGIAVNLKIVGDPQWIKQDEVFSSPRARKYIDLGEEYSAPYVSGDTGSLGLDGSEVHVQLAWNTPVDIDEETGGLRDNGRYKKSAFSGIYKVLIVENEFRGGQFTQSLEMIRLQGQPTDNLDEGNTTSQETRKEKTAGAPDQYYRAEDENVEAYKSRVMNGLLNNKNNASRTDVNTNNDKVDTTPESSEQTSEYNNSDKLKNVATDAPTETIA